VNQLAQQLCTVKEAGRSQLVSPEALGGAVQEEALKVTCIDASASTATLVVNAPPLAAVISQSAAPVTDAVKTLELVVSCS
jgi:hypothetical protein